MKTTAKSFGLGSLFLSLSTALSAAPALDPSVSLVSSSPAIADNGDFYRVVVRNTEIDPCLTLERVNLRGQGEATATALCELSVDGKMRALKDAQSVAFETPTWKGGMLRLKVEHTAAEPGAPSHVYNCDVDTTKLPLALRCRE